MHIIKLKECVMRINKRAQIFFYFLSHFLLTISSGSVGKDDNGFFQ